MRGLFKSAIFALFLLALQSCSKTIIPGEVTSTTRSTPNFTMVYAESGIQVEIIKGSFFEVVVEAPEGYQSYIVTTVSNGELQIFLDNSIKPNDVTHKRVLITMPTLTSLVANDGAEIYTTGIWSVPSFNIEASGNGYIESNISTNSLTANVSAGSELKLFGEARNFYIDELSGSSIVRAFRLLCNNAEIKVSGASEAQVSASDYLKVTATGASVVKFAGKPTIEHSLSPDSNIIDAN